MDFYDEIINYTKEEARKITNDRINYLEDNSFESNIIGYHIGGKFSKQDLEEKEGKTIFDLDVSCFYPGYIKKGTKIVYGLFYDSLGNASNNGQYYYIDSDNYIYDFVEFIIDKEVINETDLFGYILDFLKEYLGIIEIISREDMFKPILDNKGINIESKNHKLSCFKGKGNAMCTEYSIMAQNILSVFGIDSYLLIGTQKFDDEEKEWHAFNLVSYRDENDKEVSLLVDFTNHIVIFDQKFNIIAMNPYTKPIDKINQELVNDLMNNNKHLILENYNYFVLGNSIFETTDGKKRDYCLDNSVCGKVIKKTR